MIEIKGKSKDALITNLNGKVIVKIYNKFCFMPCKGVIFSAEKKQGAILEKKISEFVNDNIGVKINPINMKLISQLTVYRLN